MPNRTSHPTRPAERPTLTDRYVWAATAELPAAQRSDVASELRATIADMVDARAPANGDAALAAAAEIEALTELGDPGRLAAGYRGRQQYLIGPALFGDYRRLLVLLLSLVPPLAGGASAVAALVTGEGVAGAIGSGAWIAFMAAVQVAFWTTLAFAIVERVGAGPQTHDARPWDTTQLPDIPDRRVTPAEVVGSILTSLLVIGLLFWQRDAGFRVDGQPVPLLNPDRWDFWIPFLVAVLLAQIVVDVVRFGRGRWTYPLAAVNAVLAVLFVVPFLGLLGSAPLLNPAFFDELTAVTGTTVVATLVEASIVVGVVLVSAWEAVDGFVKAYQADRAIAV